MENVNNLDFTEELSQFSKSITGEIVSRMLKAGQKVTGKTIESITDEVRPTGVMIFAADYIMALDTGRGPSKQGPAKGKGVLQAIIKQWIIDKPVDYDPEEISIDSLAFLITRQIHKHGNWIHIFQTPTNIINDTLTNDRIQAFVGTFSVKFMAFVQSEIIKSINQK